ncbi:MAG: MBL fold metallo-hydrolase [Candidatus Saccharimonadales bacterium]
MDIQFCGANCLIVSNKTTRIVIDDNLEKLGKKSIIKPEDVALYTNEDKESDKARLSFNSPGEYEVGDISIVGISAKPFINDDSGKTCTMYKLIASDVSILVTGHILGEFTGNQLEQIGTVDILIVPVGNSGYTLDPIGALKLIKDIEPKIVIPTHYKQTGMKYPVEQIDLNSALKEIGMEVKETVSKLKIRSADLSDVTQLVVLEAD